MKIVVLDGYTLNPGDLSWSALTALGSCAIYERSAPEEVVPRSAGAEIVITNKVEIRRDQIAHLPLLRYLGVTATGYNIVDVAAARERGIPVTNVPTYGTRSVAQMTFALLLELAQHVGHHAQTVRDGRWTRSPDFCYWDYPLIELDGLTLGVVGYGRIGRAVAELARAFGMRVMAATSNRPSRPNQPNQPKAGLPEAIEFLPLDDLFRRCDVVSLHCPLTPETRNMVDARRLSLMKPT